MGNCASPQYINTTRKPPCGTLHHGYGGLKWSRTAKVIHLDGRLQEFHKPIKANQILSTHPNCFLCSIESMEVDSQVPEISQDQQLQFDQIYFLMPLSTLQSPLSLQDLCSLAIKAAASLANLNTNNHINGSNTADDQLQRRHQTFCKNNISIGCNNASIVSSSSSLVGRDHNS